MPFTVTMPKLSPTMNDGAIVKWHKKEGDFVDAGELLLEVATDKATVEYTALDEGYLRTILIKEGQAADVNQAIAIFTATQDESTKGYIPEGIKVEAAPAEENAKVAPSAKKAAPVSATTVRQSTFTPEPPLESYEFTSPREPIGERLRASPLARRLAKEKGIDITTAKGTGPNDRVMSRDLTKAQPESTVVFGSREIPKIKPGTYREETLTPMRKTISDRLQEAKTAVPHFYAEQIVDADALVAIRDQMKNMGLKLSVNDFVVRATALALREHPGVNSGFNSINNTLLRFETIDISVAVTLPEGLITPIIRHADYKNIGEISLEIKRLSARAKEGKLESYEYKGGSFTITNLGMYGTTRFSAIINPPQAAILAVGAVQEAAVVKNGQVIAGKTLALVLSSDHRVIDGVAAAEFLRTLKKYLENPAILLV